MEQFASFRPVLCRQRERPLTELVRGREGTLQAVVLDDRAAPFGVAHRPHVGHAQRVAAVVTAYVLRRQKKNKQKTRQGREFSKPATAQMFTIFNGIKFVSVKNP